MRVTEPGESDTLLLVGKSWPVKDFNDYLEERMRIVGIPDRAELARQAEIDQTQLSNWRLGKTQPSKGSLQKVAIPLKIRPVYLYLQAGLMSAEELDLTELPELPDLPSELVELVELYRDPALSDDERGQLLSQALNIARGIRAMAEVRLAPGRAPRRRTTAV